MESITSPPFHVIRSGSFLTPLMISVVGIISTSIVILAYHYILVRFCVRRQQPTTTTTNNNNNLSPPVEDGPPTGVDQKILETIPIISYATEEGHSFRLDQTECVVCLGELERGEMVRLLPTCKHAFHVLCIDQWFVAHISCPICRSPTVAALKKNPAALPLSPSPEQSRRVQPAPPDQEHEGVLAVNAATAASSSGTGKQSCSFLRHCTSLVVLPIDHQRPSRRRSITGLKRSLSMDQSSVIIEIQRETSVPDCSPSPSLKDDSVKRRLYRARSLKHLDRVSAKLFWSFSRLRVGANSEILPY